MYYPFFRSLRLVSYVNALLCFCIIMLLLTATVALLFFYNKISTFKFIAYSLCRTAMYCGLRRGLNFSNIFSLKFIADKVIWSHYTFAVTPEF